MTKKQREIILSKTSGRCAYCGCSLDGVRWHADHFKPIVREFEWISGKGFKAKGTMKKPENNNIDNMFASCPSCNIAKSSLSLEVFRNTIEDKLNQLKLIPNYQIAKRYELLAEKPKRIVFYFEKHLNKL